MKRVLRIMIDIFQPEGVDWMNFALAKNNPYNFHHIVERRNGGEKSIDNGAILTRKAHTFLHMLENICPEAYQDLQEVFIRINGTKRPVTQDIVNEVDRILHNLLIGEKYDLPPDVDLSPYCTQYFKGKKRLRKSLK